jgi:hypothetical protein
LPKFTVFLFVLALVLGILSLQVNNVANQAPPAMNSIAWDQGNLQVYTNRSNAAAHLYMSPAGTDPNRHVPNESWINTYLVIQIPDREPFEWAVAFGSFAGFPGCDYVSGTITNFPDMPTALASPDRDLAPYALGSESPVYYQDEVSWPGDMKPCRGATVIYSSDRDGSVHLNLHTPSDVPLVKESGQFVGIKTPKMGRFRGADGTVRDQPLRHELQNSAVAEMAWMEPASIKFEFSAEGLGELRQDSGTPPNTPFVLRWEAQDELTVLASLTRPTVAARNQQLSFFAGILISLAASFFVWALELLTQQHRGTKALTAPHHPPQQRQPLTKSKSADIRKWASARGYVLNKHGPIPTAVRAAYNAAHRKQNDQ